MGNFNKFNKDRGDRGGFGGGHFDGGHKFDRHHDGPRPMFQAVCNKCGQNCEVPFRPTGDRPVFCSNCFKGQNKDNPRFAPKSFDRGNARPNAGGADYQSQFNALNAKLDKVLSLLAPNKVQTVVKEKKKAKAPAKKSKSKKK